MLKNRSVGKSLLSLFVLFAFCCSGCSTSPYEDFKNAFENKYNNEYVLKSGWYTIESTTTIFNNIDFYSTTSSSITCDLAPFLNNSPIGESSSLIYEYTYKEYNAFEQEIFSTQKYNIINNTYYAIKTNKNLENNTTVTYGGDVPYSSLICTNNIEFFYNYLDAYSEPKSTVVAYKADYFNNCLNIYLKRAIESINYSEITNFQYYFDNNLEIININGSIITYSGKTTKYYSVSLKQSEQINIEINKVYDQRLDFDIQNVFEIY